MLRCTSRDQSASITITWGYPGSNLSGLFGRLSSFGTGASNLVPDKGHQWSQQQCRSNSKRHGELGGKPGCDVGTSSSSSGVPNINTRFDSEVEAHIGEDE